MMLRIIPALLFFMLVGCDQENSKEKIAEQKVLKESIVKEQKTLKQKMDFVKERIEEMKLNNTPPADTSEANSNRSLLAFLQEEELKLKTSHDSLEIELKKIDDQ